MDKLLRLVGIHRTELGTHVDPVGVLRAVVVGVIAAAVLYVVVIVPMFGA